jgi:transcriptional regulator GlxA family with amidase domain
MDIHMRIAILLYEGFDELDALGPYEVLRNASKAGADVEALLVTPSHLAQVSGSHGASVVPQATLGDLPFDVVIVPGGGYNDRAPAGVYAEIERGELPSALHELHGDGACVAAVCTGAMLVSAAGLFRGRPATTHHGALSDLRLQGARLVDARVIDDGDLLSCGGVTSGIDLALWIVERSWGKKLANQIADEMEHERRGPVWTKRQLATD